MFENFPKPMQLVVTAVVAFGGAASSFRAGTGVFFRLISIFKLLHTMKRTFDILTDA